MKHILLLVHNQTDVDALSSACQSIIASGYTGCWVLHSPAIAVDQNSAAAKFDAEISALLTAEKAAADRGDYEAAASHKLSREGKTLDRAKAVSDAWKNLTEDDRKKAYSEKFADLRSAFEGRINARVTCLQDHYEPEQYIQMLNAISGAWFKPFVHGQYVIAWPGAIPEPGKPQIVERVPCEAAKAPEKPAHAAPAAPAAKKPAAPRQFGSRREELLSMRYFALKKAAGVAGVSMDGKKPPQIVEEILAKESVLQPA